jgi:CDP-diacylglycerol---serine O-phosphatidyltransferase
MKQIPNLFTLLNLFFGCMAIVVATQPSLVPMVDVDGNAILDPNGTQYLNLPENIVLASLYICIAAVIDFLDGFVARLLGASSEIGKQLDSLADVVSFGVAPSIIVYDFLRLSFANGENGLDAMMAWLLPAFIIACAGAYRLARFNVDSTTREGFQGVPIPAIGLLTASFPLIYWSYGERNWVVSILLSKWFWYGYIIITSYLMVSTLPMLALKFKGVSVKKLAPFIIIAVITAVAAFIVGWLAVPVAFIAYVLISLIYKQRQHDL